MAAVLDVFSFGRDNVAFGVAILHRHLLNFPPRCKQLVWVGHLQTLGGKLGSRYGARLLHVVFPLSHSSDVSSHALE